MSKTPMAPVIYLIRHGEKPTATIHGVTHDGTASEHSLIPRGWERAGALGRFFVPASGRTQLFGAEVPKQLFAASPEAAGADKHEKSRREEETVSPTARLLGVHPNLDFGKGEEADVAAHAVACTDPVLIVWEHENIPKLARFIAPSADIPAVWPNERFDVVWLFRLADDMIYSFEQVPQLLLEGDSAYPIR